MNCFQVLKVSEWFDIYERVDEESVQTKCSGIFELFKKKKKYSKKYQRFPKNALETSMKL